MEAISNHVRAVWWKSGAKVLLELFQKNGKEEIRDSNYKKFLKDVL